MVQACVGALVVMAVPTLGVRGVSAEDAAEVAEVGDVALALPDSPLLDATSDGYVVQFAAGIDASSAESVLSELGLEPIVSFDEAIVGAHVDADPSQVTALLADERVEAVVANTVSAPPPQATSNVVEIVEPGDVLDTPGDALGAIGAGEVGEREVAVDEPPVPAGSPAVSWGLDRIDQRRLPLNGGFAVRGGQWTGAGVTAYVLDSGVMSDHVEFSGRVLRGAYIDDGLGMTDCRGHGTHVAGLLGGETFGVAPDVSIVPVRVLDCNGGSTVAATVTGLNWIVGHHQAGTPAVLNMSLGGAGNEIVDAAVRAAIADGIVVVAAGGNDGQPACSMSPGRVPEVITVAATDRSDWSPSWSNKGPCVDVFAPGSQLMSASNASPTAGRANTGSSMAAPLVSGAVTLMLQESPWLSPAEVALRLSADATEGAVRNAPGTPNRLLFVPTPGFVPLEPARLMDSRDGMPTVDGAFTGTGVLAAGVVTELVVAGRGGVPADASAVVLNVTVTEPSAAGFLTVFGCGAAVPNGSNLNFGADATIANAVVSEVGDGGRVCVYSNVATHVVVDVNGFHEAGSAYVPLEPARLLDSRAGAFTVDGQFAGVGVRTGGVVTELVVAGRGGVPVDASAVVLNVTVTEPVAAGFVTVFPCGMRFPNGSNLNFWPGATIANAVVAKVGDGGRVCVFSSVDAHMVVDVNGVYAGGSSFVPMAPTRVADTRQRGRTVDGADAGGGERQAGVVTELVVAGRGGVPVDASAVVLNVTVTEPTAAGFVTVFPCGTSVPNGSNLNFDRAATIPNAVIAKVGDAGKVCIYSNVATHLVVDINGYHDR